MEDTASNGRHHVGLPFLFRVAERGYTKEYCGQAKDFKKMFILRIKLQYYEN